MDGINSNSGKMKEKNDVEFSWGRKLRIGGTSTAVQFYNSFTYDGGEYFLYDCVYMRPKDEPEPYIGKLVKIWETINQEKMVEVVWFFRPVEVKHWLGDIKLLDNEILLAFESGVGLSNSNPLKAICGKCNVVCTSKDKRNAQPSEAELKTADYVFYRTFNVCWCKVSDKFADRIAGLKVEHFFNRRKIPIPISQPDLKTNVKEETATTNLSSKLKVASAVNYGQSGRSANLKRRESKIPAASLGRQTNAHDGNDTPNLRKTIIEDRTGAVKTTRDQIADMAGNSRELSSVRVSDVPLPKKQKLQFSSARFVKGLEKLPDHLPRLPDLGDKILDANRSVSEKQGNIMETGVHNNSDQRAGQFVKQEGSKPASHHQEVTRRPCLDTSKWFKQGSWEDRMRRAEKMGTLVLLRNLDPSFSSSEVEDIVWHAFKEKVTARVIPRSTFSSRHYGEAFVIFRSKNATEVAISQLNRHCLVLDDVRPVVGSRGTLDKPANASSFVGHLVIDRMRLRKQREEMRDAVSTSHFSQPNTIEYEMATKWRVLQTKSYLWWVSLNGLQEEDIKDLRCQLKIHRDSKFATGMHKLSSCAVSLPLYRHK